MDTSSLLNHPFAAAVISGAVSSVLAGIILNPLRGHRRRAWPHFAIWVCTVFLVFGGAGYALTGKLGSSRGHEVQAAPTPANSEVVPTMSAEDAHKAMCDDLLSLHKTIASKAIHSIEIAPPTYKQLDPEGDGVTDEQAIHWKSFVIKLMMIEAGDQVTVKEVAAKELVSETMLTCDIRHKKNGPLFLILRLENVQTGELLWFSRCQVGSALSR